MKRLVVYIILIFVASTWSFAQTTIVPDTNLRKFLMEKYPSYLDVNSHIIDAKAITYTGNFDVSSLKINDLAGLWKFRGLTALVCHNNGISNIDSLAKFNNLIYLYCYNNKISKFPDISSLSKLSYLSSARNQLTSLPDLSSNTALTYLDCARNMITKIKGVDKLVNLQTLYVYFNKIDSLPNLSNLTKLQSIQCQGNNLHKLPGISQLAQLTQIIAGDNKFDSIPELSKLTKLSVLKFYNCRITFVPNLSTLSNLTHLELDHNLITKLPDFSVSKNTLNILKLQNNRLDSLPDFSLFTTLDTVHVQNNRLTFEDVISLAKKTSIVNVKYAPQDSVGISQNLFITENQPFRIVIGIDKKVTTNHYTWYKNGKIYATTKTDTLFIPQVQLADSGNYSCQVHNALAPLLTLNSRNFILKVKTCIDLSKMTYSTSDFDCNFGGKLNINEASITGGQKPYSYRLVGNETGTIRQTNTSLLPDLFENSYTLEVRDQTGCKSTFYSTITLKGKRGVDCKRLVILGNDNSPNNTLFLEERGSAKVYDEEGQLVQSFSTPNTWDGKNKNGEFLPGYYVIDLNGKMLNVTLIK